MLHFHLDEILKSLEPVKVDQIQLQFLAESTAQNKPFRTRKHSFCSQRVVMLRMPLARKFGTCIGPCWALFGHSNDRLVQPPEGTAALLDAILPGVSKKYFSQVESSVQQLASCVNCFLSALREEAISSQLGRFAHSVWNFSEPKIATLGPGQQKGRKDGCFVLIEHFLHHIATFDEFLSIPQLRTQGANTAPKSPVLEE